MQATRKQPDIVARNSRCIELDRSHFEPRRRGGPWIGTSLLRSKYPERKGQSKGSRNCRYQYQSPHSGLSANP
jgi:hypothetical protein